MGTSDVKTVPQYLERVAGLPDMGSSGLGPRSMTANDVDAVMNCDDLAALAQMRGYARSYFATGGGIIIGAVTACVGVIIGSRRAAIGGAMAAGVASLTVMEARRRARQWESVLDAAISQVTH